MKKLISIKSDESGEVLYFTHKKGVDTIRKDEVVDLELLNPMKIFKKPSEGYSIYLDWNKYFVGFCLIAMIVGAVTSNEKFSVAVLITFFSWIALLLFWAVINLPFILIGDATANTRKILKIYTIKGLNEYYIKDDNVYSALYDHFKIMLSKYFPAKGVILLYDRSPIKNFYHRVMTYVWGIFVILSVVMLFYKGIGFVDAIILLGLLLLAMIYHFMIGYRSGRVIYTFNGDHLDCKYSYSGKSKETDSKEEKLSNIKLVKNKENIAVIPKNYTGDLPENFVENANTEDARLINAIGKLVKYQGREIEDVEEYIKFYEGKYGNLFHNLKVAQDFRDITPIIVRYINDLSDEQSKEA